VPVGTIRGGIVMRVVLIFVLLAGIVLVDHIRYWRQIDYFLEISNSFASMYETVLKAMNNGQDVSYENKYFNIVIDDIDFDKFWKYILESIQEVMKAYEQIDSRYFEQMDENTYSEIYQLNTMVKKINNIARIEAWKRGFDVYSIDKK